MEAMGYHSMTAKPRPPTDKWSGSYRREGTMRHFMLDLETMGKSPHGAIVAIGAVEFDPQGDGVTRELYRRVNLRSSVADGMKMDPDTVVWWLEQSEAARGEITSDAAGSLFFALLDFRAFLAGSNLGHDLDGVVIWANGASFDFPILQEAYRCTGLLAPWKYWNERDFRTLRQTAPGITLERTGTHHNALDDARHQALHLQKIMKHLSPALLAAT